MTTTTPTSGAARVHAAATLLATHLTEHELPDPAALTVMTGPHRPEVQAQVPTHTVAGVAAELMTWAHTLNPITITAWQPTHGNRIHLSMTSTLTGPLGAVGLDIYGSVDHDPALFADLAPGQDHAVSLNQLRAWAQDTPTTGGAVADEPGTPQ